MSDKKLRIDNELTIGKEQLVNVLIAGLKTTYELHERLGDAGTLDYKQNQFGETALKMDVQAEEEILSALRETTIPFQVLSEEHGELIIGEKPEYTVAIDGLDGSGEYKEKRGKAMYGTIVSVLAGTNPSYDDYLACGIMIHSPTPKLFLAVKGEGCFLVDIETGERRPLQKKRAEDFSERNIIDLDINWQPYKTMYDSNEDKFPNMQCAFLSTAARAALFLEGRIDIGLEWTDKGNLEEVTTYGLVKELGGVMTGADGIDIGSKPFKTFGQKKHIPLIVAPSQEVARQVSKRFNLGSLG